MELLELLRTGDEGVKFCYNFKTFFIVPSKSDYTTQNSTSRYIPQRNKYAYQNISL